MVASYYANPQEMNDFLKALFIFIKASGESYALTKKPDSFSELAYLYESNLKPIENTYEYYYNNGIDDKAHIAIVQMIGSICYIQSFILGRTRN